MEKERNQRQPDGVQVVQAVVCAERSKPVLLQRPRKEHAGNRYDSFTRLPGVTCSRDQDEETVSTHILV